MKKFPMIGLAVICLLVSAVVCEKERPVEKAGREVAELLMMLNKKSMM